MTPTLFDERDLTQLVRDVFAAHDLDGHNCTCGWTIPDEWTDDEARHQHEEHLIVLIGTALTPVRPREQLLTAQLRAAEAGLKLLREERGGR